jgi:hypothetical protein
MVGLKPKKPDNIDFTFLLMIKLDFGWIQLTLKIQQPKLLRLFEVANNYGNTGFRSHSKILNMDDGYGKFQSDWIKLTGGN